MKDKGICDAITWDMGALKDPEDIIPVGTPYLQATGDKSVLPGLRRIVTEASKGQSNVGSSGHRFAVITDRS